MALPFVLAGGPDGSTAPAQPQRDGPSSITRASGLCQLLQFVDRLVSGNPELKIDFGLGYDDPAMQSADAHI